MTINPKDEEALKRVINYPTRGIGKTTLDKIILAANKEEISLWEVISTPAIISKTLSGSAKSKVESFVLMIESFISELPKKNAFELASHIASQSTILKELYDDKTPEGVARYENIQELLNGVKQFVVGSEIFKSLDMFIEEISLLTDQDEGDEDNEEKVSLMTIHSAKGLEFPYVHLVGLEEGLFPSERSSQSRSELEEERRLFYVALTRAEKKAFISYASTRYKWGNLIYSEKSRFIDEIDSQYVTESMGKKIQSTSRTSFVPPAPSNRNLKPLKSSNSGVVNSSKIMKTSSNDSNFNSGDIVEHQRFGKGEILKIEGVGPSKKATVNFDKIGPKQLLLKFARLKLIK